MKLLSGEFFLLAVHNGQLIEHHAKCVFEAEARFLALIRLCGKGGTIDIIEPGGRTIDRHTLIQRANRHRWIEAHFKSENPAASTDARSRRRNPASSP